MATQPSVVEAPESVAPIRRNHRVDIQLLRALAVGMVVVFHLWPELLPGGFVGVDVFFVVSGFLITAHIVRDIERGKFSLTTFWSRRARRLLPASLTVIAVTAVATAVLVPSNYWDQFFREARSSALYVENWKLAQDAVDYLASEQSGSPVQHFWSLGVEEQFYVVTPLIILAGLAVATWLRRGKSPMSTRAVTAVVLVGVLAVSLPYSLWLTATDAGPAYFHTGTRAWEFVAGGLLALLGAVRLSSALRWVFAVLGFGLIAAAGLAYVDAIPFPGLGAIPPVVGSLLVVFAHVSVKETVVTRPIVWLGDASYSIYLWHWPLIVVGPFVVGRALGDSDRVAIFVVTLVLAAISLRWIETPLRASARDRRAVAWAWLAGLVGMSAIIAGVLTFAIRATEARHAELLVDARAVADAPGECVGAMALQPGCEPSSGAALAPDPAVAFEDMSLAHSDDACVPPSRSEDDPRPCVLTAFPDGLDVALVGDSHMMQWEDALGELAQEEQWSLVSYVKHGCPFSLAEKANQGGSELCLTWTENVTAELLDQEVDIVVVSSNHGLDYLHDESEDNNEVGTQGLIEAWYPLVDASVPIVTLRDNPHSPPRVAECLEFAASSAAERCVRDTKDALGTDLQLIAADHFDSDEVRVLDLSDHYCESKLCRAVVGDVVVYRDSNHVTRTYVATIAAAAREQIVAAIAG